MLSSVTFWTEMAHCLGVWDSLRDAGKEYFRISQEIVGCLEGTKHGEKAGSRWNKHGKGNNKGKKHWSHANHANKWLLRPCPAPDQHSLPHLLIELLFQFLSCMRGLCSVCMEVFMRATGVRPEGLSVFLSVVPATRKVN